MPSRAIPGAVLAFDPGPHTGYALFLDGALHNVGTINKVRQADQYKAVYDLLMYVFSGKFTHPALPDPVVVVEDFRSQTTVTRDGYTTIQLVGFIVGTVQVAGFTPRLQLPAARRAFLGPALDVLHNTIKHPTPHERDAVAHGLAYLATLHSAVATAGGNAHEWE